MNKPLTEFGKAVKLQLIIHNQNVTWLAGEVRRLTGAKTGQSYISWLLTQFPTPSGPTVEAIKQILDIS